MNHYGTITALFHGKAENLRKLTPLVWDKPELEELKPFQAVLVKCNPKTGAVTRVEEDDAKFGPEHDGAFAKLLPEVSVRTEEKDGKRFYLDTQGNEYFFLGDLPKKAIQFGRIKSGWFDEYPDRPAWLRE